MVGKTKLAKAGLRAGARVAPGASRHAGRAGKYGGKFAGKAAARAGKAQAKLAKQAMSSKEPAGSKFLKYGLFALAGFALGALLARMGKDDESSIVSDGYQSAASNGRQGETWGSGSTGSSSASQQTGADRAQSDPSSGPLIGEQHRGSSGDVPQQQEEVENRIRTRVGEDDRTKDLPKLNVEVNDGVAEIRGVASTIEIKDAIGEIAADTDGVREVRNLVTVN